MTLKVFEDNVLVRELLETKGEGRVLVVDGGGSMRCALVEGIWDNWLKIWGGLVLLLMDASETLMRSMAVISESRNTSPKIKQKRHWGEERSGAYCRNDHSRRKVDICRQ